MVDDPAFLAFQNAVSGTKGIGNGKTVHLNIDDAEVKSVKELIHFLELGSTLKDDGFEETMEQCRTSIINAHGLHPELVGIIGKS